MEEKERYEFIDFEDGIELIDTENKKALDDADKIKDTLNQQDKRIKELEEQLSTATMYHGCEALVNELKQKNQQFKQQLEETKQNCNYQVMLMCSKENVLLKQQLHDLPKNILKDIQENFDWKQCCEIRKYYDQQYIWFNYVAFNDFLESILKKYGGENE